MPADNVKHGVAVRGRVLNDASAAVGDRQRSRLGAQVEVLFTACDQLLVEGRSARAVVVPTRTPVLVTKFLADVTKVANLLASRSAGAPGLAKDAALCRVHQ